MLKILDRYILKQFILFLFAGIFIFIFIFLIVDISDNLNNYIDSGRSIGEIFSIYIFQIPSLIILLFPVGALIALFFSIGIMVKNNELIAVKGAGISIYRFLMPLIISILLISSLLFFFNEYITTVSNRKHREIKDREKFSIEYARDFYVFQDKQIMLKGKFFNSKQNFIESPEILYFNDANHLTHKVIASKAYYQEGFWHLENALNVFFEDSFKIIPSTKEIYDIMITPDDILIDRNNVDIYRIGRLRQTIEFLKKGGYDYKKQMLEILYRYFYIIITLIIILIGSAFVIQIKTHGIVYGLSLSILISFVYWGTLQGFRSAGETGHITPFISMLMPNFIFLFLGLFLLIKARK